MPPGDRPETYLAAVLPVVRMILARKTGMSLAESDTRRDNQEALELFRDIGVRLWEVLASDGASGEVRDFRAYAARVTYNAWADHLRAKYPQRTSLKNRLRRFLTKQPVWALWENADGDWLGGMRKWELGADPAPADRIARLIREGAAALQPRVPTRMMERMEASDWDALLAAVFRMLGGPVTLDDLVAVCARILGVRDDDEPLALEDEEGEARPLADERAAAPDVQAHVRQTVARLWAAIVALRREYRVCYLLNIPGPGKSRGDIEVFLIHGVTTLEGIGTALELEPRQYALMWDAIPIEPSDRTRVSGAAPPEGLIVVLLRYLPLVDMVIARTMGFEPQQVINRRNLALSELRRALEGEPPKKTGPGRKSPPGGNVSPLRGPSR